MPGLLAVITDSPGSLVLRGESQKLEESGPVSRSVLVLLPPGVPLLPPLSYWRLRGITDSSLFLSSVDMSEFPTSMTLAAAESPLAEIRLYIRLSWKVLFELSHLR